MARYQPRLEDLPLHRLGAHLVELVGEPWPTATGGLAASQGQAELDRLAELIPELGIFHLHPRRLGLNHLRAGHLRPAPSRCPLDTGNRPQWQGHHLQHHAEAPWKLRSFGRSRDPGQGA